eukprot:scaffold6784_cov108-Cylindrotheca_fusiformis.AAC.14
MPGHEQINSRQQTRDIERRVSKEYFPSSNAPTLSSWSRRCRPSELRLKVSFCFSDQPIASDTVSSVDISNRRRKRGISQELFSGVSSWALDVGSSKFQFGLVTLINKWAALPANGFSKWSCNVLSHPRRCLFCTRGNRLVSLFVSLRSASWLVQMRQRTLATRVMSSDPPSLLAALKALAKH